MSICLTLGANPQGDRIGFRYWESPNGPFASYKFENATGTFLGVWAVFVNALFAYVCALNVTFVSLRFLFTTASDGHGADRYAILLCLLERSLIVSKGVTVGECSNPRKNVPSAIKKTFWRILIFYVGCYSG